jgi:hypothetical protein
MTAAYVFIQVSEGGDAQDVHKKLHAVEGVRTVHFLAGPTDVVAFVEAADMTTLIATIGKMRSVKGIAHTDTRIVLPIS